MTTELLPCPFCGGHAKVYGSNVVGCVDTLRCGGVMDFGHWCGEQDGTPAVEFVIRQWNSRAAPATSDAEDAAGSVWIVLDENGSPDYCATYPEACHEHINEALMDGVDVAAKWVVREATYIDAAAPARARCGDDDDAVSARESGRACEAGDAGD